MFKNSHAIVFSRSNERGSPRDRSAGEVLEVGGTEELTGVLPAAWGGGGLGAWRSRSLLLSGAMTRSGPVPPGHAFGLLLRFRFMLTGFSYSSASAGAAGWRYVRAGPGLSAAPVP